MTSEVAFRLAFPQATLGTRSGLLLIFPCVLSDEKGEAEGERGGGVGEKKKDMITKTLCYDTSWLCQAPEDGWASSP